MSNVDNRVVKMVFDNAQFEKKIKETMQTLSEFERKLKMDGAASGMDEINKAANKVDLSILSKKANKEAEAVGSAASDAAKNIGKITDGANNVDLSAIGKGANKESGIVAEASGDAAKSIGSIGSAANNVDFSPIAASAYSAVDGVNLAASSIDLSKIINETDNAASKFSALEQIGIGALRKIGAEGIDWLSQKIKAFTIDPIVDGFKEYEAQIGSIQTILANTGMNFDSDADIGRVNDALDELNKYADETIYKFGDMTEAIGTFTSAGLSLDEAVAAVKGTANVAAFSGASASDVHRVLPQISQALSAGEVGLIDWKSIETAHMASQGFVEAIGDMAVHMATVNKAGAEAAEAGQALVDHEITMRQALNKVDNEQWAGWLNSDILSEALATFTYDTRKATKEEEEAWRAHLEQLGYFSKEEQDALFERAEMATRAATEVRTWDQLWDTVGESIGSNWAGIWRNLLGDFKQATDTFTFMSNTISDGIDGLLGGIVNAAKQFNSSGAIDIIFGGYERYTEEDFLNGTILDESLIGSKILDAEGNVIRIRGVLDNLIDAITKPLGAIGDAFNSVFGPAEDQIDQFNENLGIELVGIAQALDNFTSGLIISDDAAQGITHIFEGLFSVLDVGLHVVLDIGAAFFELVDILRTFLDPAIDIALTVFGQLGRIVQWACDKVLAIRAAFIEATAPIRDAINVVQDIIRELFGFADIPGKIEGVGDMLLRILDTLWSFVDIPGKISLIGDALGRIFNFIGDLTGWNKAVEESNRIFNETGEYVSAAQIWFEKLANTPVGKVFVTIRDAISGAINKIKEFLEAIFNPQSGAEAASAQMNILVSIIDSIQSAFGRLGEVVGPIFKVIADGVGAIFNVINELLKAIGGLAGKAGEALKAWGPLQKISDKLQEFKDGAIGFFLDLPNKVSGMSAKLEPALQAIQGGIGRVVDWLTKKIEYISSVDPSKLISDIGNNISNALSNFNLESIGETFNNIKDKITDTLSNGFKNVGPALNEAKERFKAFFDENGTDADTWSGRLKNAATRVKDGLSNAPQAIAGAFQNLKNILAEVFGWIGEKLSGMQGPVGDFFRNISGHVSDAGTQLQHHFNNFKSWMSEIGTILTDSSMTIPEKIKAIFGNIGTHISPAIDHIKEFISVISNPAAGSLSNVGSFLEDIKNNLSNKFENLREFLSGIPEKFVDIFNRIRNTFSFEKLQPIIDFIKGLAAIRTLIAGSGLIKKMTGTLDSFKKLIDTRVRAEKVNTFTDMLRSIAISMGIMGATLYVISTIPDPQAATQTLTYLAGMLTVLTVISGILDKIGLDGGDNMIKVAGSIGVFALSMLVATYAIDKLTNFDWEKNRVGLIAMGAALGVFTGILIIISRFGKEGKAANPIAVAASIGVFAISLGMLVGPLEEITKFIQTIPAEQYQAVAVGLGVVAAFILAVAGALRLSGDHPIAAAAGFLIFAAAITIVSDAVTKLININNIEDVITIFGWLAALFGEFFAVIKLSKSGDVLKSAAGLLIYAGAIAAIAAAIWALKDIDITLIGAIGTVFAVLIGEFGNIVKKTKGMDLVGSAAAMLIFALAVDTMAVSIYALQDIDPVQIGVIGVTLAALVGAFGLLAAATKGVDLVASAAGVMGYAASLVVIALAIQMIAGYKWDELIAPVAAMALLVAEFGGLAALTNGIDLVATAGGVIAFAAGMVVLGAAIQMIAGYSVDDLLGPVGAMALLIAEFGGLAALTNGIDLVATAGGVIAFSAGMIILADAIQMLSDANPDALGPAVLSIGGLLGAFALMALITNGIDLALTAGGIMIFAAALIVLAEAIKSFMDIGSEPQKLFDSFASLGYNITAGLVEGLVSGVEYAVKAILGLGQRIFQAICQFFGIASPSTLMADQVGQFIPEGISLGITENAGGLMDSLGGVLDGLMANLGTWVTETGIPMLQGLLGNVWTWFTTEGIPMIGQMLIDLWTWFTTEGIPMIQQLLTDLWTWLTTVGFPMLGQMLTDLWNWFTTEGIPMLGQVLSDLWNWFTTDGLKMLGDMLSSILAWLGDLAGKFWNWFTTEGLPMLGKALGDFWNWFTTEGLPKLGEFIVEIMGKLGELLGKLGEWVIHDGLPALGDALGKFWNWCITEGLPKLGEFILGILGKLGEFLLDLGKWVLNDALPAIGQALLDILAKLGELPGKLVEWAASLPGKILEGLGDIAKWAGEIGSNIINGIVDGIKGIPNAIGDALCGAANSGIEAVKNFLGIHSPSTVMRDQIGKFIDTGLAKGIDMYKSMVTKASEALGINTGQGLMDGLSSFDSFGLGQGTGQGLLDGLGSLDSFSLGQDAGQGLMNGLNSFDTFSMGQNAGLGLSDGLGSIDSFALGQNTGQGLLDGLGSYDSLVSAEGFNLGQGAATGINSGLGSIPVDYESSLNMNASIVPVLDPNSYENVTSGVVDSMTAQMDMTAKDMTVAQSIDAQLRTDDMTNSIMNAVMGQTVILSNTLTDVYQKVRGDIEQQTNVGVAKIDDLRDVIGQMSVQLDSGALVGAIAPQMDQQLATRQSYGAMGIY